MQREQNETKGTSCSNVQESDKRNLKGAKADNQTLIPSEFPPPENCKAVDLKLVLYFESESRFQIKESRVHVLSVV